MYEQPGKITFFASFPISLATSSLQTHTDHYAKELSPKMNRIIQFHHVANFFAIT